MCLNQWSAVECRKYEQVYAKGKNLPLTGDWTAFDGKMCTFKIRVNTAQIQNKKYDFTGHCDSTFVIKSVPDAQASKYGFTAYGCQRVGFGTGQWVLFANPASKSTFLGTLNCDSDALKPIAFTDDPLETASTHTWVTRNKVVDSLKYPKNEVWGNVNYKVQGGMCLVSGTINGGSVNDRCGGGLGWVPGQIYLNTLTTRFSLVTLLLLTTHYLLLVCKADAAQVFPRTDRP